MNLHMTVGSRWGMRFSTLLAVLGAVAFGAGSARAQGPTNVCGTIDPNHCVWTIDGSPYVICSGGAHTATGVTLTIDPGVAVQGGALSGTVNASGASFTNSSASGTLTLSGCTFTNTSVTLNGGSISGGCAFTNGAVTLNGGSISGNCHIYYKSLTLNNAPATDCWVEGVGTGAGIIINGPDADLSGCHLIGCSTGVQVNSGSAGVTIDGCEFEENGTGLFMQPATGVATLGTNTWSGNTYDVTLYGDSRMYTTDVTLVSPGPRLKVQFDTYSTNQLSFVGGATLTLIGPMDVVVVQPTTWAIALGYSSNGAGHLVAEGVRFEPLTGADGWSAVGVNHGESTAELTDCVIEAFPVGVIEYGGSATLTRCVLHCGADGVRVNNGNVILNDCLIEGCSYWAVSSAGAATLTRCEIRNSTEGVSIRNNGNAILDDCTLQHCTKAVGAYSGAVGSVVRNCRLLDNTHGVYMQASTGVVELTGNTWSGNTYDVTLYADSWGSYGSTGYTTDVTVISPGARLKLLLDATFDKHYARFVNGAKLTLVGPMDVLVPQAESGIELGYGSNGAGHLVADGVTFKQLTGAAWTGPAVNVNHAASTAELNDCVIEEPATGVHVNTGSATLLGTRFDTAATAVRAVNTTGLTARYCDFTGCTWGVNNTSSTTVDARWCCWGGSGPGPVGPGTGANVSTNVLYQPWRADCGGPPRVHALLVGCEQWAKGWTYHGMKDALALGTALLSLGHLKSVKFVEIWPTTSTPKGVVLDAIDEFTDPNGPNAVSDGDSFVLFIGCHGVEHILCLQVDAFGNLIQDPNTYLHKSTLREHLDRLPQGANKVVILPGCHTGSFWDPNATSLYGLPNTCLFAGAPADADAPAIPDVSIWPRPWFFSFDPTGMTPLTVTLVVGLTRAPWTTAGADLNRNGIVTFGELRDWVLAANSFPLLSFGGTFVTWSSFTGSNWPILDGLGDWEPFSYAPATLAPDGFDDAPLAAATSTPGDLDSDGDVDLADLAALQVWAGDVIDGSASIMGDFDVSGTVDGLDFVQFGACVEGPDALSMCQPPGCGLPAQDTDRSGRVDSSDFACFEVCFAGPVWPWPDGIEQQPCMCLDQDNDLDVDLADWAEFQCVFTGD